MLRCRVAGVPALTVGLLVVLVQSAELTEAAPSGLVHAEVDTEILIDEGLGQPLTNMDPPSPPDAVPPTPAVTGPGQKLIDDVEKSDPAISIEPTELVVPNNLPPNEAQAALTAQLGAMTDADGKSVVTGTMPDPANTTISVDSDIHEYPAGDDDAANAMMGGQSAQGAQAESASAQAKFRAIPFFKFAHDGTVKHGYSQMECQQTCADDEKCMSYSFNEVESSCITATSCVQYDLEFDFFARQPAVQGETSFKHLGAMKYLYTGKGDTGVTSHVGRTQAFCEDNCKKDPQCKSFCFRRRDKLCLTSTQDLGYEQGWNYYEKAGAAVKAAEALKVPKQTATTKDLMKELPGDNATKTAAKETSITEEATADATPSVSKQIVQKENAALSEEQLEYMKKNMPVDKSPQTAAATVTAALTDRTAQLTAGEAARVEVAKKVAEKVKQQTFKKLSAEMQGKKLFESEMRATDDKVRFSLEAGSKQAWKTSETNVKTEEMNKENTQKQNREDEAELERQKTARETSEVAQQELEASDDVNELEGRKKLYKEALDHFNELDVKSIQKLEFLKKEESRAAVMIAESKKRDKLNEYETDETNAEKDIDEQQKIQIQKADAIKLADEKIPDLMREKSDGEIAEQEAENEKAQAQLAAQGATSNTEVTQTQKAIADADAKLTEAKSTVTKSTEQLNTLKQQVSQGHTLIAESKSKEETSVGKKNKAAYEYKVLKEHLDKLEADGTVLHESSKYQKGQTINNEFSIKTTLANKMKEELEFQEGDSKKKLKLKDLKLKLSELEAAGKEQDVEKKVKVAVTFEEKSTKAEVKVDDKVKNAKADEERSVKMLAKAKLAAAEAITTSQKVDAAKQESEAGMLKVSSEQQMVALEPDLQHAKEAEQAAQDKLQALKDMFKDDEAAYKKAMGMFNAASSALAKAKLSGALDVVKKETAFQVGLEEKSAVAQGISNLMKGYNTNGTTASERASNALNNLSEQDIKLGKKSKVVDQVGKGGALTVEQHIAKEKKIKADIALAKSKEANIKKAIAAASQQNAAFNEKKLVTTEEMAKVSAEQEKNSKETKVEEMKISNDEEKAVKAHETKMAKTQEQTQKSAAVAATQKESSDKTVLKLSSHKNGYGCDVSEDGKPMNLEQKERCSKDKSSTLEDQEKQAKSDAQQREAEVKLKEKEEKDSEKQEKSEGKVKASKREKDSKESEEKEKAKKAEMTEEEQKESKKKTDEQERVSKESNTKQVERDETASKEEEKKTSEKNEKENATKEAETKSKEKNGKQVEKATKEKTQKDAQTEKEKKESQSKIKEQNEKTNESETKESASKSEDEKADKEGETKEQATKAQEKDTKEKAEKADMESETKTKEHATKQQAADKEKETKKAETEAQEQASKEKATKDQEAEANAKESAKKTQAQQTQATESNQKSTANEGTQKVNAQQASAGAAAAQAASTAASGVRL